MQNYVQEALSAANKWMNVGTESFNLGMELFEKGTKAYKEYLNGAMLKALTPTPAQAKLIGMLYAYRIAAET
jgi:hypothetical protein